MYNAPNFLILAPIAVEDSAQALSLMTWFQTLGQYVKFPVMIVSYLSASCQNVWHNNWGHYSSELVEEHPPAGLPL